MTTPTRKTKTTAAAYEAARRNREAAEQAQAEAVAALTGAEEHHADLVQRNRNGDTTITGMDLLSADADVAMHRGSLPLPPMRPRPPVPLRLPRWPSTGRRYWPTA